jgi:MoxR-like ATPase
MLPLIMPNQDPETSKRVLGHVASHCDKYGTDVKHVTLPAEAAPEFKVGMSSGAPVAAPDDQTDANCRTCSNYVDAGVVVRDTGWTGSICKATGNLMPDSRLPAYARRCGKYSRQVGPRQRGSLLNDFHFFPQYDKTFGLVDFAKSYRSTLDNFIDPREYPNERELNPRLEASMARRGIRAWRRITDPAGYGEDVWLPIYDLDAKISNATGEMVPFLSHVERELVPKSGDDEHPELYADHGNLLYAMAVLWMKLDETPAWWGQGGTGKTEFARHLSWMMQLPFHRIVITGSSEVDDLVGKMLFEKDETVFQYGQLTSAWTRPGIILLDEPNTGPAEVWQVIRPLTDNSKLLTVMQNKNERLKRHPECFFTMAMNPAWDPRNIGAQMVGDADGSRLMHMFFSYPPEELEKEIIQRRVRLDGWEVPTAQMGALMRVAVELRQASDDGLLHSTWGVRHQIKLARALRYFQPVTAYKRAVGDYLDPQQMEVVLTIVKSHFGE